MAEESDSLNWINQKEKIGINFFLIIMELERYKMEFESQKCILNRKICSEQQFSDLQRELDYYKDLVEDKNKEIFQNDFLLRERANEISILQNKIHVNYNGKIFDSSIILEKLINKKIKIIELSKKYREMQFIHNSQILNLVQRIDLLCYENHRLATELNKNTKSLDETQHFASGCQIQVPTSPSFYLKEIFDLTSLESHSVNSQATHCNNNTGNESYHQFFYGGFDKDTLISLLQNELFYNKNQKIIENIHLQKEAAEWRQKYIKFSDNLKKIMGQSGIGDKGIESTIDQDCEINQFLEEVSHLKDLNSLLMVEKEKHLTEIDELTTKISLISQKLENKNKEIEELKNFLPPNNKICGSKSHNEEVQIHINTQSQNTARLFIEDVQIKSTNEKNYLTTAKIIKKLREELISKNEEINFLKKRFEETEDKYLRSKISLESCKINGLSLQSEHTKLRSDMDLLISTHCQELKFFYDQFKKMEKNLMIVKNDNYFLNADFIMLLNQKDRKNARLKDQKFRYKHVYQNLKKEVESKIKGFFLEKNQSLGCSIQHSNEYIHQMNSLSSINSNISSNLIKKHNEILPIVHSVPNQFITIYNKYTTKKHRIKLLKSEKEELIGKLREKNAENEKNLLKIDELDNNLAQSKKEYQNLLLNKKELLQQICGLDEKILNFQKVAKENYIAAANYKEQFLKIKEIKSTLFQKFRELREIAAEFKSINYQKLEPWNEYITNISKAFQRFSIYLSKIDQDKNNNHESPNDIQNLTKTIRDLQLIIHEKDNYIKFLEKEKKFDFFEMNLSDCSSIGFELCGQDTQLDQKSKIEELKFEVHMKDKKISELQKIVEQTNGTDNFEQPAGHTT